MYVTITGARNNSGDFLIRARALSLLARVRPDREIHNLNSWEKIEDAQIEVINSSKALILAGGPSIRHSMVPTYDLPKEKLEKIKVPIVTLGTGWKHPSGSWSAVKSTRPTDGTVHLLSRIAADGLLNSVRDLEAKAFMRWQGVGNVLATGCPALFAGPDEGNAAAWTPSGAAKIVISVGVLSRLAGSGFEKQFKDMVDIACDAFSKQSIVVAFHHAVDSDRYAAAYAQSGEAPDLRMLRWVESKGLEIVDISGGEQGMIDLYASCSLHIGYRVHAHILCTSLSIPSILIAEDSRAFGVARLVGGWVIPAFEEARNSQLLNSRILNRLRTQETQKLKTYSANPGMNTMLEEAIASFEADELARFEESWRRAAELRSRMLTFLNALP